MRDLGKTWLVKVKYWYQSKSYTGNWEDSGLSTDSIIIEEDNFTLAGGAAMEYVSREYSNIESYRNLHVEVYAISEYETPSNFIVKEY